MNDDLVPESCYSNNNNNNSLVKDCSWIAVVIIDLSLHCNEKKCLDSVEQFAVNPLFYHYTVASCNQCVK
ncbi:hypothetical protein DERP_008257 [Dermatophagoides pteronyssinus]|uniref:Uncharacterized protein n=1 Tax=Dermatophagoides pteronyssinus TaxID=6956 RepID=A0ABQ8J652_DERPT|nr:hypothetical protein DERP_008257 [Dermatophagoides pteronyssinus]